MPFHVSNTIFVLFVYAFNLNTIAISTLILGILSTKRWTSKGKFTILKKYGQLLLGIKAFAEHAKLRHISQGNSL